MSEQPSSNLWLCQRLRSWPVGEIGKEAATVIERLERELADTREAYLNQSARLVAADETSDATEPGYDEEGGEQGWVDAAKRKRLSDE